MSIMEKSELVKVLEQAAEERGCTVAELDFNDDDNVFFVAIDKPSANVDIADCEYVHRAVLAAFDRNIEDYSLTVSSVGISGEEADEILRSAQNDSESA